MSRFTLGLLLPLWLVLAPALRGQGENAPEGAPVAADEAGADEAGAEEAGAEEAGSDEAGSDEAAADEAAADEAAADEEESDEAGLLNLLGRGELATGVPEGDEASEPGQADGEMAEEGAAPDEDLANLEPLPRVEDGGVETIDPTQRLDQPGDDPGAGAMVLPETKAGDGPGVVEGVVFGADGKGVPGVIVIIPDLGGFKVRAGPGGDFRITGLPAQDVTLTFMKAAYLGKEEVVQVKEAGVTKVRTALELKPVELAQDEYNLENREVLLDYEEDEFGGIMLGDSGGLGLGGGLGREQFSEVGVTDAAGALTKVSGANLVGGRYAVVRGLGDRYTNTTLNLGLVPSADPSRKAVQLDLFPTDLLQSVAVRKTFRPDLPAEFVGGLIDIKTMRLPDGPLVSASVGTRWNSEVQGTSGFREIPGGEMGFFAKNDDQILDNPLVNPVLPPGGRKIGNRVIPPGADLEAIEAWNYLYDAAPFFSQRTGTPDWDRSLSMMLGNNHELDNGWTLGWFGNFTHERKSSYRDKVVARAGTAGLTTGDAAAAQPNRFIETYRSPDMNLVRGIGVRSYRNEDEYVLSTEWGLLLGGSLQMGDAHSLTGTFFKYRTGDDSVKLAGDLIQDNGSGSTASLSEVITGNSEVDVGYGIGPVQVRQYWETLETTYRDLQVLQIGGSHDFRDGGRGVAFDWLLGQTKAEEERPRSVNTRLFQLTTPEGDTILTPYNYYAPGNPQDSFILSTGTFDEATEMRLDGTVSFLKDTDDDHHLDLKLGLGRFDRDRRSDARRLRVGPGSGLRDDLRDPAAGQGQVDDLASGTPYIDGILPNRSEGWVLADISGNLTLEYEGRIELTSGYVLGDWAWGGWNLMGGGRYENERRVFTSATDSTEVEEANWFPAVFASRKFGANDAYALDVAWSQTIARPIFYEFVDAFTLDQANDEEFRGNPDLRDTKAVNLDLRLSRTGEDPGNSMAVGLFYKDLDGPIFQTEDPFATGRITWLNLPSAQVQGIELDFARVLGAGFKTYGNLSYIATEVEDGVFENPGGSGSAEVEADSLEGQPTWLGNLSLVHEYEPWDLTTTLSYNYTGSFLHRTVPAVGASLENPQPPNIIRQPFHSLDLIVAKRWEAANHGGKISFKLNNLLDADEEYTYGDLDIEPFSRYSPGRTVSVSLDFEW